MKGVKFEEKHFLRLYCKKNKDFYLRELIGRTNLNLDFFSNNEFFSFIFWAIQQSIFYHQKIGTFAMNILEVKKKKYKTLS